MHHPGVSVRPIRGLAGDHEVNEVFLDTVRVPVANRLGEEGAGFMALMTKLQQERLCVAIGAQASAEQVLDLMKQVSA